MASVVSLFVLTFLFFHAQSATYWEDIQVLKNLKSAINPNSINPGSCLSSWDFSLDPCDNLFSQKFTCGFQCDTINNSHTNRITELTLDQAGYSGYISSVSFNLPFLQTLDLSGNYFTGSIPTSLQNLTRLQTLNLAQNSFTNSIPFSFSLPDLQELYLNNNNLTGEIPSSLNNLTSLTRLELQSNQLGNSFPDLSQLVNLYFLDSSDNFINKLPTNFPPSLVEISMRDNQIQGNIPVGIMILVYLQVIDLSHNNLTGVVPSGLFNHPSLQQLTISYNEFTSVDLNGVSGKESELIAVDLSNNELHGFLPAFMGLMPKLSALSLENNKLTGMIPTQYAVKTAVPGDGLLPFERLLLGGNYLFGAIPGPFMRMKGGSVNVSLGDNCLYRCPASFFFCQGGEQKSLMECKTFGPMIP